jgi:MFS family permease
MPGDIASESAPESAAAPVRTGFSSRNGYRYFVAAVLCVVYTFNFLDRQFLAILAQPVKLALHLSDTQLGLLTGLMFGLFYTCFGIPVAALADRFNRVWIITIASGLWSLFSAACGLATGFTSLAIARLGVGIGEAGGSAPSYSIISDYFPPNERGVGLAIYSLGVPIGIMVGAASGGWIAAHYGWRAAFLSLGAISFVLSPLIPLLVREPKRGRLDASASAHAATPSMFKAISFFVRSPTLMLTALSAGLTALVIYGLLSWMPAFLMREKGMTLTDIAFRYSVVAGGASAFGTTLGGWLVDRVAPRRPALYALIPGLAVLIGAPFLFALANAPGWPAALAFMFVPYAMLAVYLAPGLTVIQNGVPVAHRAAAGALFLFMLNLIGMGCGPLFVGMISDRLAPTLGVHALKVALECLTPFFVLAFLCQMAAAWRLHADHKLKEVQPS